MTRSDQDVLYNLPVHVGEAEIPALEAVGQLRVVDPQAVQDGGVQVMHMDGVVDDVVAEVVRLAIDQAPFDASAGHPNGEAARMMVTAVVGLGQRPLAVNR